MKIRVPIQFQPIFILLLLFSILSFILTTNSCKKEEPIIVNNKPEASLIYPEEYTTIFAGDSLLLKAEASDTDGNLAKVFFYANRILLAEDSLEPYEYQWNNIPGDDDFEKTYSLHAMAIDSGGLTSERHSYTRITVYPETKFIVYTSISSDNHYVGDDIEVRIGPVSPFGEIVLTELYIDDVFYKADSTDPYEIEWLNAPLGEFKLQAKAIDDKNNIAFSTVRDITINENILPTIKINTWNRDAFLPGSWVYIDVSADDENGYIEQIDIYHYDTLLATYEDDFASYTMENLTPGEHEFFAVAYDNNHDSIISETETITIMEGFKMIGQVSEICNSGSPDRVFALNKDKEQLYIINPQEQVLESVMDLPDGNPIACDYSSLDERLFIVSENSGQLSIWDDNTASITSITYSNTQEGQDIEVDPIHRRIYISTNNSTLFILDMDNYAVLLADEAIEGISLAINETEQLLYTTAITFVYKKLYRYSVVNDQLTTEEIASFTGGGGGIEPGQISISPDKNLIIVPRYKLHGIEHETSVFDATNLNNIIGGLSFGNYFSGLIYFNQNGTKLYVGLNDNIGVFNTETFSLAEKIFAPNSGSYFRMAIDDDESWIIAYTSDDIYGTDKEGHMLFLDITNR